MKNIKQHQKTIEKTSKNIEKHWTNIEKHQTTLKNIGKHIEKHQTTLKNIGKHIEKHQTTLKNIGKHIEKHQTLSKRRQKNVKVPFFMVIPVSLRFAALFKTCRYVRRQEPEPGMGTSSSWVSGAERQLSAVVSDDI